MTVERRTLEKLFEQLTDKFYPDEDRFEERKAEFVFHMRDCCDELLDIAERLNNLHQETTEEDAEMLFGFFVHGLNHLYAARRISIGDWPDPFENFRREEPT
jgi:hypothetical protein